MTTDRATLLATINASPMILSLLFDLNLMPEEVEQGSMREVRMKSVVGHVSELEAEIATLRAQVAAGDALRPVVLATWDAIYINEYGNDALKTGFDCQMLIDALDAYDAAKGVKP